MAARNDLGKIGLSCQTRTQPAEGSLSAGLLVHMLMASLARAARTFLAFPRLLQFGFLHHLAAASGSLLVGRNCLDHPTCDALVTGHRFNHVQLSYE
jgi:hypothetical protein